MTTQTDHEVAAILNDLIETCKDGELGFRKASEDAKDPSLKSLFAKYSIERAAYSYELQRAVQSLDEKPETSGTVAGRIHRGWISLKDALTTRTDKSIVEECEAGEDAAMKAYKEALEKPLPMNIATLIEKQFSGVKYSHSTVSELKHSYQGNLN